MIKKNLNHGFELGKEYLLAKIFDVDENFVGK